MKNYQIKNPEIKKIGLDNFINKCLEEEAAFYGFTEMPREIQPIHQRKLVVRKPFEIIGPKID